MSGKIKGSKTEINLLTAFAGESQARNRYTFAASVAKKEGYVKVYNILTETANQEKEHAERLFGFLEGGEAEVKAAFPAGVKGDTVVQLTSAAAGEHYEWTEMYPGFAKIAKEEGFNDIAAVFQNIAVAERYHEKRFNDYIDEIKNGTYFKSDKVVVWRCQNCGFLHVGLVPPNMCPACAHPIDHFEKLCDPHLTDDYFKVK